MQTPHARNTATEDDVVTKVYKYFITHTYLISRAHNPFCISFWRCFLHDSRKYCRKVSKCTSPVKVYASKEPCFSRKSRTL